MLTSVHRSADYLDPSAASVYSNNNAVQYNQATDFVGSHADIVRAPILDIGCGTGEITAQIGNTIAVPITGIDVSADRIKFANENYATNDIQFMVANAITLDEQNTIPRNYYNTIVSFSMLHHIPDTDMQLQVFKQAKSLLKTDGVILFLIPGRSPELHDAINEVTNDPKWQKYFSDFDFSKVRIYQAPEYYKKITMDAGFYACEATMAFENGGKELDVEGMKKFFQTFLPHLAHLKKANITENVQNDYLSEITKLYFAKLGKEETATVNPKITQNRIIAYASPLAFFKGKNTYVKAEIPALVTLSSQFKF
jgi:SAM-dependent methyltransferase